MRLVKITLYTALGKAGDALSIEDTTERLAEVLRYHSGVLTVASDYDERESELDEEDDDATDDALMAMAAAWPDVVPKLPVPGTKVLGRNGTFKKARLEAKDGRVDLWLGTAKEQYPLVSFPVPRLIVGEEEE